MSEPDVLDTLIDNVMKIANHSKVVDMLEPNIMWHQKVESWMVRRVLLSYCLLQQEEKNLTKEES